MILMMMLLGLHLKLNKLQPQVISRKKIVIKHEKRNFTFFLAIGRHKRLASDDEDEFEYRNLVTTPKKQKKTNFFHTTTLGK